MELGAGRESMELDSGPELLEHLILENPGFSPEEMRLVNRARAHLSGPS